MLFESEEGKAVACLAISCTNSSVIPVDGTTRGGVVELDEAGAGGEIGVVKEATFVS